MRRPIVRARRHVLAASSRRDGIPIANEGRSLHCEPAEHDQRPGYERDHRRQQWTDMHERASQVRDGASVRYAWQLNPHPLYDAQVSDIPADRPKLTAAQIGAVTAGNALEFYDFVTYA